MYRRRSEAGRRSQVEQAIVETAAPSRNRPQGQVILVVLLFALPLLALLVREQSRVIDAQRRLIIQLSVDSSQLNTMRMRELQNRAKAGTPAAPAAPTAQAPSANTQQQPQQPSAAPEHKPRKRQESKQQPTPGPQEYPASRSVPVRKSV